MSSPFFIEPQPEKVGVLFLLERRVRLAARFVAPAFRQAGFFIEPQPEKVGVLLFIGTTCLFRWTLLGAFSYSKKIILASVLVTISA